MVLAIPPDRTVLATLRSHAGYIAAELAGSPAPRVLVQPENRGTAAGVLFPAHWIQWQDPEATVAVFPSDHFILDETAFMEHVSEVAALLQRHPEWLVLLGAQPSEAETGYGWIEPGEVLDRTAVGPLWRVQADAYTKWLVRELAPLATFRPGLPAYPQISDLIQEATDRILLGEPPQAVLDWYARQVTKRVKRHNTIVKP